MIKIEIYFLLIFLFNIYHVQKKKKNLSIFKRKNLETQMIEVYNEAWKNLKEEMLFLQVENLMKQNFIPTINLGI